MNRVRRTSTAQVQPWTARFDQGSYISLYTEGDYIRIVPRKHWTSQWAWWAVKTNQLGGKKPTFIIAKSGHFSYDVTERLAVWSQAADTDTWYDFDNVVDGASDFTFYNNTPFPNGMIYISALPMYPFSRVQRMVKKWAENTKVTETPSSTGFIVGKSTWRQDGNGNTVGATPRYGFKITSTRHAYTKNKAILTAYNHPSETPGPFQLEGAIDWLLSGDATAEFLLDYFDFYVYPCLNPQGVNGGFFRSSPQTPASDNNRLWNTTGTNEDVDAFKAIFASDTGSAIQLAHDFHSWMSSSAVPFLTITDHTIAACTNYLNRMATIRASYTYLDSDIPESLKAYHDTFSPYLAIGNEIAGGKSISVPEFKNIGRDVLKADALLLAQGYFASAPSVGSRNFASSPNTDRIDRTYAHDLGAHALTISMWVNITAVPSSSNGYLLQFHPSGDATTGMTVSYASGRVSFIQAGNNWYCDGSGGGSSFQIVGTGWTHVLITYDGTNTSTSAHLYKNGTEVAHNYGYAAPLVALTGTWSIMGRKFDDLRNGIGNVAQFRVFDRVLDASEIALEAGGILTTSSGLLCWLKAIDSSLVDAVDSVTWVADGTTEQTGVGNGPPIIYG